MHSALWNLDSGVWSQESGLWNVCNIIHAPTTLHLHCSVAAVAFHGVSHLHHSRTTFRARQLYQSLCAASSLHASETAILSM